MKILIAADMEGITGVVNWDQVDPAHAEYARFRRLMTQDVNAAIRGATAGGATEIIVTDGHAFGHNILIEELESNARLNSGNSSPFSMVQGIGTDIQGVIFVGYHARAGAANAVLNHTWSRNRVQNVWLNGQLVGEIGLNASVCGHYRVPVLMISGDQTACAEAASLLGKIEVVVVKQAYGRLSAECLPPPVTHSQIFRAAERVTRQLATGQTPSPLQQPTPIEISIQFNQSEMAETAARMPGADLLDDRRIRFTAPDMPSAYTIFRTAVRLGF